MSAKFEESGNGNDGSPSFWRSCTTAARAIPKIGDGSPSCQQSPSQRQTKAKNGTSHWQRLQQALTESDKRGNVNDSSPSCRRRRTMAEMDHPVVGKDGQRWQRQQSLPQLLAEMDNGGSGSPSCQQGWMVATPNAYWHAPQWQQ